VMSVPPPPPLLIASRCLIHCALTPAATVSALVLLFFGMARRRRMKGSKRIGGLAAGIEAPSWPVERATLSRRSFEVSDVREKVKCPGGRQWQKVFDSHDGMYGKFGGQTLRCCSLYPAAASCSRYRRRASCIINANLT